MANRKLHWGILGLLLVFGLILTVCKNDGDDGGDNGGGNGGGDIVPAELKGHWLRDTEGTERYLVFTGSRWGTDSDSFTDAEEDASWVITSAAAGKVEYQSDYYPQVSAKGSFNWTINATTLTISNTSHENYMSDGTYTKQP